MPDKPADPKEVELTEADEKTPPKSNNQEQLTVDVEITFWTHVGWDGVLVMLFSLGIAGLFVYIVYLYTKKFQAWHRPGVWVFMVFAVLYVLLVVKCLWTWKKMATAFTVQQQAEKDKSKAENGPSLLSNVRNKLLAMPKMYTKNFKSMDNGFCGSCMFLNCLSRRNSVSTWSRCICALCRWVGPPLCVF